MRLTFVMSQAHSVPGDLDPEEWKFTLTVCYTDGTSDTDYWREAPHDYAKHLTMVSTVVGARIEARGADQPEWYEYRDGELAAQAPGLK